MGGDVVRRSLALEGAEALVHVGEALGQVGDVPGQVGKAWARWGLPPASQASQASGQGRPVAKPAHTRQRFGQYFCDINGVW